MAGRSTGRKPKPTALHELHGNPSKLPPRREPKASGSPMPPEWLSDRQKASWTEAVEHAPRGVLKRIDLGVLTGFIIAQDLHRQACQGNATVSLLVKVGQTFQQNPYLPIINRQALIMRSCASELGFTPTSRPRLAVAGGPLPSPAPEADEHGEETPSLTDFLKTNPDLKRSFN